ncbi:MAG: hypothetical protein HYY17_02750 [Planctomycetes bacterium]|nr:hypothetical protein [Planctomycetota bacterium]
MRKGPIYVGPHCPCLCRKPPVFHRSGFDTGLIFISPAKGKCIDLQEPPLAGTCEFPPKGSRGADKGNVQAWVRLARAYRFGIGVRQDRSRAIEYYRRAEALGDKSSAEEIRWLKDPTNCVGFASEVEHAMVIAGRLRFSSELWGDMGSAGLLFRNSAERMKWAIKLRGRVDADEAEVESWVRHSLEVNRLIRLGYSRGEADRMAGW